MHDYPDVTPNELHAFNSRFLLSYSVPSLCYIMKVFSLILYSFMAISSLPSATHRYHVPSLPTQMFITLANTGQFIAGLSQSMSTQFGPGSEFQSSNLYMCATTKTAACSLRGSCNFHSSGWEITSFPMGCVTFGLETAFLWGIKCSSVASS